jgi:hypothetical protein
MGVEYSPTRTDQYLEIRADLMFIIDHPSNSHDLVHSPALDRGTPDLPTQHSAKDKHQNHERSNAERETRSWEHQAGSSSKCLCTILGGRASWRAAASSGSDGASPSANHASPVSSPALMLAHDRAPDCSRQRLPGPCDESVPHRLTSANPPLLFPINAAQATFLSSSIPGASEGIHSREPGRLCNATPSRDRPEAAGRARERPAAIRTFRR